MRVRLRAFWDRLVASDPGLTRLVNAGQVALSIGVTIAVQYAFMQATHAMWSAAPSGHPPSSSALAGAAAQHHAITLLGMLIGGIVAMMSALAVMDPTPRAQTVTLTFLPIPVLASMALSIELSSHHTVGLVGLALVMGIGTYMRKFAARFGPRAFLYGVLLFIGYFFGFLAGSEIPLHDLGWVAAILWLAVAVNVALKLLIFVPLSRGVLGRMERAFEARARRVAGAAARLLDATGEDERRAAARRLRRRLVALNEGALLIDAQLNDARTLPAGTSAWTLHRALFEIELAVQNIGRVCERLAQALPDERRGELAAMLVTLRLGEDERGVAGARAIRDAPDRSDLSDLDDVTAAQVHVLAVAVIDTITALREGATVAKHAAEDAHPFRSSVTVMGGNLPGSSQVSAAAAAPGEHGGFLGRLHLDAPAQTAIRVTLAVGAACALGSVLSERRFYWAVIAVFVAFMGANTTGEQITKAANRVLGTVVGILLGSLIAQAVGPTTWSLAVILPALAIGVYFLRVSYSLMVIGITIMVAQLYVLLGEYSNSLLTLRLEETALGAAIAMLAALLIFPVRTRRTTRFALSGCLAALGELLDHLPADPHQQDDWAGLRADQRALDVAVQQLMITARPLIRDPFMPHVEIERNLALIDTVAHYARNVVAQVERDRGRHADSILKLRGALDAQRQSLDSIATALHGSGDQWSYTRIATQLAEADRQLAQCGVAPNDPQRLAIHALDRLDETLAELADALGIPTKLLPVPARSRPTSPAAEPT